MRPLVWWTLTGVIWLSGALAEGDARLALWTTAMTVELVVVWLGFPLPGLGRTRTTEYTITGEHMAERAQLFVLLALGESILVTGASFGELTGSVWTVAAFVTAIRRQRRAVVDLFRPRRGRGTRRDRGVG